MGTAVNHVAPAARMSSQKVCAENRPRAGSSTQQRWLSITRGRTQVVANFSTESRRIALTKSAAGVILATGPGVRFAPADIDAGQAAFVELPAHHAAILGG